MKKVQTGFVIEFYSNACLVRTKDADIPCIAIKDIVVGDVVKIEIVQDSKETKGLILSKENRKSALQKKEGLKSKTIAANVTYVGIMVTQEPKTASEFIDKWILTSLLSNIRPFIINNKIDLEPNEAYIEKLNIYRDLDIKIISISAKNNININEIKEYLEGKCVVFVGNSGAGKSTLTNCLTGKNIKTNSLSNNQGVHTTSISTLYEVKKNIRIIDSPGVRDLPITGWRRNQIIKGFVELHRLSERCKFNDCNHSNNEGCAILNALGNGEISKSRYNNFIKFRDAEESE
ncbi:MAG: ribosome small subunit-dependent GTPase A [Proteobacteria bacterium]|jgi:ribosome biogenesis GTPase / thiamine phosphate phosphatase|nr:ribosome small subunit-dependent GTPase A [Pseudomonadota bacterium]MDA0949295.1 ribosome small subunit-dependent GTPase A [Pseudomonadota bacterium]MDA1082832.1 ribosome small subunit-dependent GTPase A [Pseudomonadota bacterium]MDC1241197.1 ribosome small subunit-dependent GTPase A [Gammaproteobacteria bacterium]